MKFDSSMLRLYAVTDRSWLNGETLYNQVEKSLKGGVSCLQLREKDLAYDDFLNEAILLKKLCTSYSVPFIVNDNVDIAIKCGADGIHVGQSDMAAQNVRKLVGDKMILGVSAQTVKQAIIAQEMGADYLGVGAVFPTSTKTDADFVTYETLKEICSSVKIPVVAIGGITSENIIKLQGSGIAGAALVSAIYSSGDIENTCKELFKKIGEVI